MMAKHSHILSPEYPAVEVGGVPLLHSDVGGEVLVKPGLVPALPGGVAHTVQLSHQQHHGHQGQCRAHGHGAMYSLLSL